jgi:hypothetical protein
VTLPPLPLSVSLTHCLSVSLTYSLSLSLTLPISILFVYPPLLSLRWWQGLDLEITGRHSIHSPLGGIDISLSSAQHLARTMDELGEQRTTKLLNFAHIEIERHKLLGQGSFSRVYRGTYRGIKCAVKLIYTMDLTEDVIQRVAAEANILSSMKVRPLSIAHISSSHNATRSQNQNIVKIYGISVLPPRSLTLSRLLLKLIG